MSPWIEDWTQPLPPPEKPKKARQKLVKTLKGGR